MSAGPLVVEIICTCCLAAFLLHRYGDLRKQHVLVTLATFVAWYFSFMIIFVLPLDVSSTFYRQCLRDNQTPQLSTTTARSPNSSGIDNVTETPISPPAGENSTTLGTPTGAQALHLSISPCEQPLSHVPDDVLPALWHVVYWTSQFLTWLLLPMMQSYSTAGDFSVAGKIKTAIIENIIYYATYLLIFGVCLIYVAVRPDLHIDAEKLKVIGVTASNTWGLFLLVLLLGYGLVEVPRTIWNSGKTVYTLQRTQFKIAKLSTEKTEAEENLEDVLDEIKQVSEKIRYNHPLRKHMDTILLKCPDSLRQNVCSNNDDYEDFNKPQDVPSEKTLVRLHKHVIQATQTNHRTQAQWNNLMSKAYELENISSNEGKTDRIFLSSNGRTTSGLWSSVYTPTVEWYWKCLLRPWFRRILAVLLTVLSFMVVWSECLFFIKEPVLSLFAVFIDLAKQNYDYVYIELASIITIAYLCFCAYYSVFQIRILNFYYIAPHHQTDEYSLVFTGMMLCRLTPPLCLNFLGLIHLDSHITYRANLEETSYTEIMGHMDVISFVSDGFNIYFPIAIVLLCICTYFSLGSRILQFLGFSQFIGDDDMTQEFVDEGREIIRRERRRVERKAEGEARRRQWTEKFGDGSSDRATPRGNGVEQDGYSRRVTVPEKDEDLDVEILNLDLEMEAKQTVPRSPDENDRTELLRQAEPIDYTGETTDVLDDWRGNNQTHQSYQSQAAGHSSRFGSQRSFSRPPKGIFDDV
ncbi:LMBR1 domain-containing protein 2-like isoform X2 [Mizuhopecten yessoensis]|uniref:LMBR1 domain-containing protein 2 n=1 Tax=Mizuhopecten yessoensis TaxID=6573 RepID=A0A210PRG8_MIZYE|nr:LMBR1 domain-containing protein 2-like isoform X2 [Mizuhopecten yessoensis]OWF39089.1 LMBR1 domain-containing protein 2 [Mizuhopecten yessoensis]